MDANHQELIRAELGNARERLRAARALLELGLVPDAISRAYYSAFHAAKAALLRRGIHSESHAGLKALFGLHLVEPGLIDRRLGKILSGLMERRESADYDVWNPVDHEDARRAVAEASEFLDGVEVFLGIRPEQHRTGNQHSP